MNRRLKSIGRVSMALLLAVSLGLVMAAPVAAAGLGVLVFQLGVSDPLARAEWTTAEAFSGGYAVRLNTTGGIGAGEEARIRVEMPAGTTLADIETVSWQRYIVSGFAPHLDIILDLDGDGTWDSAVDDALVFQYAYNPWGHIGNGIGSFWDAEAGVWRQTFSDSGEPTGPAQIDADADGWATTGAAGGPEGGDENFILHTLTEWKAGVTYTSNAEKFVNAATAVLALEIEVDYWAAPSDVYVDDIEINGTTYNLEPPPPLDELYYAVGDVPVVTIYDESANLDPMAIDIIDVDGEDPPNALVHVASTTDTTGDDLVLTETAADSGEFRGSFTLLGEAPANRAADEIVVSEGDTITLTYSIPDGAVPSLVLTGTAEVDEAPPAIDTLSPVAGTIQYDTTPIIQATLTDATSGINAATIVMTVNDQAVTPDSFDAGVVTYTSAALLVGSTVDVTVDVSDNAGNSATASWSFSIAGKFNIGLTSDTTIPAAVAGNVEVTFKDANNVGIQGEATDNQLASVQVTLSGVGVDEDSGVLDTGDLHTFSNVKPEQAGTITVTVVGTFGPASGTQTVETKTLDISVTGYLVEETWADDVGMDTTGDISMRVTTKAGVAVNTGIVTISAAALEGFAKDVDPLVEGDEPFQDIIIDGSLGTITYDGTDNPAEDYLVSDGYYEVTGIKFADIGAVTITVQDAGSDEQALFETAFTVLGINVYDLSFELANLTAGVEATLVITVTEAGEPVTDVAKITVDDVEKASTPVDNVYTFDVPLLVSEVATLSVTASNTDGSKYGTASLEVALPTVSAAPTLLLAAAEDTVSVTVTDAQGEPLATGRVWLGTYDGTDFISSVDEVLDDGAADLTLTPGAAGTLVWKVGGSGVMEADAALVLEPSIAVEAASLSLAWEPVAPEVGEAITFTVTDNYGEPAGDINVTIVTPGGDPVDKVTTPLGVFMYTPTEPGDYYVSVGEQDPVTVTVVVTRLASIASSPESADLYVEETEQLAVTATYGDASTDDVTADATYASDEETVATVSVAGLITAVAEGTATITVSYTEGVITETADVLVTVSEVPVLESIAASPSEASLNVDETEQLAITATYSDASTAVVTADATYASDEETVATVSVAGLVTAVAEGTATITVSYTEDGITVTADVSVTVTVVEPLTIQLYEGANPILYTGATMDLPEALTDIEAITEIIWQRDVSTGGAWWSYLVSWGTGEITQLENGTVYIIVVSEDCFWELSQ